MLWPGNGLRPETIWNQTGTAVGAAFGRSGDIADGVRLDENMVRTLDSTDCKKLGTAHGRTDEYSLIVAIYGSQKKA